MHTPLSTQKQELIKKRIRELSNPKEPISTGMTPDLKPLPDIQAVLFDVYGTILISGTEPNQQRNKERENLYMGESWDAFKITYDKKTPAQAVDLLFKTIDEFHQKKNDEGIDYPEVDIIAVWQQVMKKLKDAGSIEALDKEQFPELVTEFVMRYDQPWPMPGFNKTMKAIKKKEIETGIISNSQFYSPLTLEALYEKSLEELGFNSDLCFWSFSEDIAKPSIHFYERAQEPLLTNLGIQPNQVLFVGNDLLNDVYPAQKTGFKTAFFAGDKRSLRLRKDDDRCKDLQPDITITHLTQIIECLE